MELFLWCIAVGVTLLLGVPPLWVMVRNHRSHIRKLWARIDPAWEDGVRNGGWLIITNGSDWPAWNVLVMSPDPLHATDFESVGPGEARRLFVSEQELGAVIDQEVTMQLEDVRHKCWLWTPIAETLSPIPPPITPLARSFQSLMKLLSDRRQITFLTQLPHGLLVLLWGYDPMGADSEDYLDSHLRRARQNRFPYDQEQ